MAIVFCYYSVGTVVGTALQGKSVIWRSVFFWLNPGVFIPTFCLTHFCTVFIAVMKNYLQHPFLTSRARWSGHYTLSRAARWLFVGLLVQCLSQLVVGADGDLPKLEGHKVLKKVKTLMNKNIFSKNGKAKTDVDDWHTWFDLLTSCSMCMEEFFRGESFDEF